MDRGVSMCTEERFSGERMKNANNVLLLSECRVKKIAQEPIFEERG